ncbi:glycosyltransferase family 2 protein [Gillisia limnaea]|uniref:Glycosyl transferase family 2 n=1 Tax=Gillisia limnaea (strain DSM 15749 / LMG 21470 / R-8282) TaxID=865937 RepID=H2BZZ9_GILLR|nr:glycosyltransferase family 2 protein [Gillisia limnaea]EHQ02366.1 glycosyl transferase family 2 [Gillisia limnaea DSM 15749]
MDSIAVLLTCHNRKHQTLQCLEALSKAALPEDYNLDLYLVDDGSTDGTGSAVEKEFPDVTVIQGSGDLFWNQGMRMAWKTAAETKEFDFYLWLNDDTILDKDGLVQILNAYGEAKKIEQNEVLITAACRAIYGENNFSYGGRNEAGPVIPNGELKTCKYINGNVVLISKIIFKKIGNLSNDYTHGMGDFDYGLRAAKNGFQSYTTKNYVATCPPNGRIPSWCNPEVAIIKRWKAFHSPLDLNITEYNKFRKKFWGNRWIIFSLKAYLKMLSPSMYIKLSKN